MALVLTVNAFSHCSRRPKRSPTPTGSLSRQNSLTEGDGSNAKPLYLCSPFADAALVNGNFKTIVMLPKYVDVMEWVAVNSSCPFEYLNYLLIDSSDNQFTISTQIWMNFTGASRNVARRVRVLQCLQARSMSHLPPRRVWTYCLCLSSLNYLWTTPERKQVSLSAPTYIDSVMSSVQNLLEDENVFPTKSGWFSFSWKERVRLSID